MPLPLLATEVLERSKTLPVSVLVAAAVKVLVEASAVISPLKSAVMPEEVRAVESNPPEVMLLELEVIVAVVAEVTPVKPAIVNWFVS